MVENGLRTTYKYFNASLLPRKLPNASKHSSAQPSIFESQLHFSIFLWFNENYYLYIDCDASVKIFCKKHLKNWLQVCYRCGCLEMQVSLSSKTTTYYIHTFEEINSLKFTRK